MDEDRKTVLLKASYEILVKCEKGPFVQDVLSMTVEYDDATCDGYCLMDDIEKELGLAELLDRYQMSEKCDRLLSEISDARANDMKDKTDIVSKALRRAWNLGQTHWQQASSEDRSEHRKAEVTQAKFNLLVDETCDALTGCYDRRL